MIFRVKGDRIKFTMGEKKFEARIFNAKDAIELERFIVNSLEENEAVHPELKIITERGLMEFPWLLGGQSVMIKTQGLTATIEIWDHVTKSGYHLEGIILKDIKEVA